MKQFLHRPRFRKLEIRVWQVLLPWLGGLVLSAAELNPRGAEIYQQHCANCHGENGEGVADEADEPLYGTRNLGSLTRYIHRRMPEEEPELVVDDDAAAVAEYIYHAFYSPESRPSEAAPQWAFVRLTNRQFRESIADLGAPPEPRGTISDAGGLKGEYFQSDGMNKKSSGRVERLDRSVDFDFGADGPMEGIGGEQFSIAWTGSLLAGETGWYEFRISTPNGARLYFNGEPQPGDSNHRDDSGAKRQEALIDEWVSSGPEVRTAVARVYLLGGRGYPIRLDYFKYMEPRGMLRFEWKPPHGEWEVLSAPHLSPQGSRFVTIVDTAFPPDDSSAGFEQGKGVSRAYVDAVAAAALEIADQWSRQLPGIKLVPDDEAARVVAIKEWLVEIAERAFRAPLGPELREMYIDRAFEGVSAAEEGCKRSLIRILTSPRFLYPELDQESVGRRIATRLALGMWDSLPDAELLRAADAGELTHADGVRKQAQRMMEDARARAKLDDFFAAWLGLEVESDLTRSEEAFPDFNPAIVADLRASLTRFAKEIVWSERSDFRELLTSDVTYLNERLAGYYGAEGVSGPDLVPVKLDENVRSGVLTHPFTLARLAHFKSSSPIHRGVYLTRNVLGMRLKPPPEATAFDEARFDPSMSTREKVAEMTKESSCMICHETINPLGFALEGFDATGRFRELENGRPVDTESDFMTAEGLVLHLKGARDVATYAVESADARRGFIRQLFQETVHQPIVVLGAGEIAELDEFFQKNECNIRQLMVEIQARAAVAGLQLSDQASR